MRLLRSHRPRCAAWLAVAATPLLAVAVPPTIDGRDIPNDFAAAPTVAVQRFQTSFGDNTGSTFHFGSELDRMFVMNDNDFLYIGITGNLENNGNCIVVFLDVDGAAGGSNTLITRNASGPIPGFPRYLGGNPGGGGLHQLTFDAGFFPDYAIGWSGGSPLGSQTRSYYLVNFTTLGTDPNDPNGFDNFIAGLITDNDPTASGPSGTLGTFLGSSANGILAAADNDNGAGVDFGFAAVDDPNIAADPNTAVLGFEVAIPLSLLGVVDQDQVCLLALVSGPDGFVSNQLLPPPATETTLNHLAFPPFDLGTLSGNQYICHTITIAGCGPGCNGADLDGDCDVDLDDLTILLQNFAVGPGGDIDGDGDTDLDDLTILLQNFSNTCP